MRNADFFRIAKSLLPKLPGFETNRRSEIFIVPIGHVLRGFTFESSAYNKEDFDFWWFFMPICRPRRHLALSYGERLGAPSGFVSWRIDMPDLQEQLLAAMEPRALPLLQSIRSISDILEAIRAHNGPRCQTDINILDDVACLQILDRDFDSALSTLDQIVARELGTDRRQWILDIVDRMKALRLRLLESPQLAVDQVRSWQDCTFKALSLEQWRY